MLQSTYTVSGSSLSLFLSLGRKGERWLGIYLDGHLSWLDCTKESKEGAGHYKHTAHLELSGQGIHSLRQDWLLHYRGGQCVNLLSVSHWPMRLVTNIWQITWKGVQVFNMVRHDWACGKSPRTSSTNVNEIKNKGILGSRSILHISLCTHLISSEVFMCQSDSCLPLASTVESREPLTSWKFLVILGDRNRAMLIWI